MLSATCRGWVPEALGGGGAGGRGRGAQTFVNFTKPAKSWDDVIDYWVEWDCDAWVRDLVERQPALRCGGR